MNQQKSKRMERERERCWVRLSGGGGQVELGFETLGFETMERERESSVNIAF
jgi:hypothetical protein